MRSTILVSRAKFLSIAIFMILAGMGAVFPVKADAMAASDIVSIINADRQQAGLTPLAVNGSLSAASAAKARDMLSRNYWSHNSPDGAEPWHFFDENGYDYTLAGENLAKNFTTAAGVVEGWMNSPTHRANILDSGYKEIGVAAESGILQGQQTVLIVAHFGARREVASTRQSRARSSEVDQTSGHQSLVPSTNIRDMASDSWQHFINTFDTLLHSNSLFKTLKGSSV